jgi:hypothetical protein
MALLWVFGGSPLAMAIIDHRDRKVRLLGLVLWEMTLACNLTVGFVVGIALAYARGSKALLSDAMRYALCLLRFAEFAHLITHLFPALITN